MMTTLFDRFDRDKNGCIDQQELLSALNDMGLRTDSAQAAALLARYDANKNSVLEMPEFNQLIDELRQFAVAREQPLDSVSRAFTTFDTDGSNAIEHAELHRALNALGLRTDLSEAERVLRRYDSDANGKLDAAEWRVLMADLRRFLGGAA